MSNYLPSTFNTVVGPEQYKPRLLSNEEINNILKSIPNVKSAAVEVGISIRNALLDTLKTQLYNMNITPNPQSIDELINEMVRQFNESLIKPGEMVGLHAAEALSQAAVQQSLNAGKHSSMTYMSSSSDTSVSGMTIIRELIEIRETKNLKSLATTIHFKYPYTFDEIIQVKRPELVDINIGDLMSDYEPDTPDNIMGIDTRPFWYDTYRVLFNPDIPESKSILRLIMNVNKMYAHRITMEEVALAIERNSSPQSVVCVFSPLNIGIIDIYPIEELLFENIRELLVSLNDLSSVYLKIVVHPSLYKIRIKGIPDIKSLYPSIISVYQIVRDEHQIINATDDDETIKINLAKYGITSVEELEIPKENANVWVLRLNMRRIQNTGVGLSYLVKLLQVANITILKIFDITETIYLLVQVPNLETPKKHVDSLIAKDNKEEKEYDEEQRAQGRRFFYRAQSEIAKASKYIYAEAEGSNLSQLMTRDDIEPNHTFSNSVVEIFETLGIEAARNYLIFRIQELITMQDTYINIKHILVIVDYITQPGNLIPISSAGVQKTHSGPFTKAAFERPAESFARASLFGEGERVQGGTTAVSIFTGSKGTLGSGYREEYPETEEEQQLLKAKRAAAKKKFLERGTAKVDPASLRRAIKQRTAQTYGESRVASKPKFVFKDIVYPQLVPTVEEVIIEPYDQTQTVNTVSSLIESSQSADGSDLLKQSINDILRQPVPIVVPSQTTVSISQLEPISIESVRSKNTKVPLKIISQTTLSPRPDANLQLPSNFSQSIKIAQTIPQPIKPVSSGVRITSLPPRVKKAAVPLKKSVQPTKNISTEVDLPPLEPILE